MDFNVKLSESLLDFPFVSSVETKVTLTYLTVLLLGNLCTLLTPVTLVILHYKRTYLTQTIIFF